jgi:hypothetical protein
MTPEHEEFQELRKLLALKRHETPPPGYFENFSSKILARIEAETTASKRPWWSRWLAQVDLRPAVACSYALGVGGLLVVGLSVAIDTPPEEAARLKMLSLDQPLLATHPTESAGVQAPQLTLRPMTVPGDEPSAVGAVLNPDAAPAGFFRADGVVIPPDRPDPVLPTTLRLQQD